MNEIVCGILILLGFGVTMFGGLIWRALQFNPGFDIYPDSGIDGLDNGKTSREDMELAEREAAEIKRSEEFMRGYMARMKETEDLLSPVGREDGGRE